MTKPIGWWLMRLDGLLEQDLDRRLEPVGLDRRHWQVLNLVAVGTRRSGEVTAGIAPFIDSSEAAESLLSDLTDTGWLERTEDLFDLTDLGQSRFEMAHRAVTTARERVSEGISRRDYETTVSTLRVMCENLGQGQL